MEIVNTTNDEWRVGSEPAFRDDASPTPNVEEKKSLKLIRKSRLLGRLKKVAWVQARLGFLLFSKPSSPHDKKKRKRTGGS